MHYFNGRITAWRVWRAGRPLRLWEARRETYEQLIALGNTLAEAWALMEQMDFAEDYDEADAYCHAEDYDGE